MSKLTVKMTNKGKRQVIHYPEKKIEGRGENRPSGSSKKDRNARHSYHQGGVAPNSYHQGGMAPNGYFEQNNNHYNDLMTGYHQHSSNPLLSRERSFVRPKSKINSNQVRDPQFHSRRKSGGGGMSTNPRGKPAMEIYRPPTLRGSNGYESTTTNGFYENYNGSNNNGKRPGLNIHAKEFICSDLHHSKSSSSILIQHGKHSGLQHSKSGHSLLVGNNSEAKHKSPSPPKVHFSDDKENDFKSGCVARPTNLVIGPVGPLSSPIKRSKSLGSADIRHTPVNQTAPMADIGSFSQDVQTAITKAINDPNALSARQLMEVVRHVFLRVIEASRYSEPTARICIAIIEKEKGENFLETLLNTCQEYFQQRDRLLRTSPPASHPAYVSSHPKWIAYMSFLNEMYTQLKRRHVQLMTRRMRNSETAPGLLLLTLLAQCCQICLKEQAVNSLAETECLFFVLTAVGKDIEVEIPAHMARVMGAARDAFLTRVRVPAVRKTLLQLIEMHAARWQLPAPAVMYYYPGSGAK